MYRTVETNSMFFYMLLVRFLLFKNEAVLSVRLCMPAGNNYLKQNPFGSTYNVRNALPILTMIDLKLKNTLP